MKVGIVICTYNRPEYLRQCVDSLIAADIPTDCEIAVVDDCSTDRSVNIVETLRLESVPCPIKYFTNEKKSCVSQSLLTGFNYLYELGCDIVINLDSDAIVRNDFISVLTDMVERHPAHIVTGFNCLTKNSNGTDRHPIIKTLSDHHLKKSVGGINMAMREKVFRKYMEPALKKVIAGQGNWDHMTSIASMADNKPIVVCYPSVVQHIGFDSSMNHLEQPDIAEDFKPIHLPDVTLVIVDCVDINRAIKVVDTSCENILFGDVKILTSIPCSDPDVVKIPPIRNKTEYSRFMIAELHKYISTSHVLVIQYDGFVMNYKAWDKAWLNYDYIGATWWYRDGMNVGNGGFSLRSAKLQKMLGTDPWISRPDKPVNFYHPEDEVICRNLRPMLQSRGIVFAPEEVAKAFSIEGYKQDEKQYRGQFGFHGDGVKWTEQGKDIIIINQFFGLGDILFCIPIARDYIKNGHRVVWPVESHYVSIGKHFPDILFIDKKLIKIDYEQRQEETINGCKTIPLRWSQHNMKVLYKDCMKSKYTMFGQEWKRWRELTWTRDDKAETSLFTRLGITNTDKYIVVNRTFQSDNKGFANIKVKADCKIIDMKSIDGYTMLDWAQVLEHAHEIHTVSTSIIYMLETMELRAKAVHIYIRRPQEQNHDNYRYILTNKHKYIFEP